MAECGPLALCGKVSVFTYRPSISFRFSLVFQDVSRLLYPVLRFQTSCNQNRKASLLLFVHPRRVDFTLCTHKCMVDFTVV